MACNHPEFTVAIKVEARYEVTIRPHSAPDPYMSDPYESFAESASCTECGDEWSYGSEMPKRIERIMQEASDAVEALLPKEE
jgi:hypothetical protein